MHVGPVDSQPPVPQEPPSLPLASPQPAPAARLESAARPWLIIGQLLGGLLLAIVVQFVLSMGVGFVYGFEAGVHGRGADPAEIGQRVVAFLATPLGFLITVLLNEAVFLSIAFYGVWKLTGSRRENLGLPRPALSWPVYLLLAAGTVAVAIFGDLAAAAIKNTTAVHLDVNALRSQVTWTNGVPFIAVIALAPGFAEELLFRGYVQRRLLRRWRPWSAILFTSLAFAISHLDPVYMVFALPLGIWLGILAWRTNSIWPGVVGHATVNALWNIWGICVVDYDLSEDVRNNVGLIATACALVALIASIVVLRRVQPPVVATAIPLPTEPPNPAAM